MANKLAVITGAAGGIGLALAKACILENMHVVMVDIDKSALQVQVDRLRMALNSEVVGIACDVTNEVEVKHLAKHTFELFDRVDLLINNAGISGPLAPIWELSVNHVRQVLDVNLYGVVHCIQAFLPFLFQQSHRSHIVNMASFYGLCSGSEMAAYAMSKHAIIALSESMYFDLRRLQKNVDVSVACPSFTNTQLLSNSEPPLGTPAGSGLHKILGELMARGRPAEDVADCIMQEIKKKTFYILPDVEVKQYYEERSRAIIDQTLPHEHSLEKIFNSLSKTNKSFCL